MPAIHSQQEHVDPGPALEPYVQDALDEIEYVTGGADTKWGAERIKDGHPAPFPLHYVEVGNEDGFDQSALLRRPLRAVLSRHQAALSRPADHRHHCP